MKNNKCIYSDKDSVVLTHKLPEHCIRKWNRKNEIRKRILNRVYLQILIFIFIFIFIFYAFNNEKDQLILKFKNLY